MSLHFAFTADNANFMRAVHEVSAGMREASRQIEAEGGNIDRVIYKIRNGIAALGVATGLSGLINQVKDTRGQFQMLEISFNTMLGSAEKANTLLNQLVRTAAITPFDLKGVANGAKQLLAYGVSAEDVNETLVRLGDICAGLNIPLNDLVYLYGTTITQGRMFTQDLRQFQGRGIPIADELAKQFGVAKDKVGELVTAGKVGAKEFREAIISMTEEGSQFGGLMEAQSKSIPGQISNIGDAIDVMFNEIGKSTEGITNATLSATGTIVENWKTVLAILGDITVAYGAQKAILALDAGFTQAATNYGYDAEIELLKSLIPLKEEEQQTALQQAVASGELTKAKAAEIASLREEAQEHLKTLTAKEASAKAEAAMASAKAEEAQKVKEFYDEEVQSYAEKLKAVMETSDAAAIETAVEELNTAESMRNEAANIAQTASKEAKTAATNAAAASQARETLATQIDTAQTAGNTAATGVLTIAKEKLAIAIGKVNAMLKANQFAIAAGAVIALGYAVYKLFTYQNDYQKSLEKVSDATKEATVAGDIEIKTLDELKAKLDVAQKGSNEWKAAKDAIVKQFGQYIPQLDEEITKVGGLSSAYRDLVVAIQQANAAKGLKKFLDDNDNYNEVATKFREGLEDFRNSKGRLSNENLARLEPILKKYAVDSSSDKDIFTFIQDELKTSYGVDAGRYIYEGVEHFLKHSVLRKINEAHKMNWTREREIDMYRQDMNIDDNTYNKVRYGIEPIIEQQEEINGTELDKKIKEKRSELPKYKKESEEYQNILKEINALEAERIGWGSESDGKKKSTGPTTSQLASKQADAHQKLIDLMKQQTEERLRLQQEYEYQQWQNRIDLMAEGEAKVIAQMQLDNDREKAALDEQKKQAVAAEIARQKAVWDAREDEKASKTKGYGKQVFNPATDVNQAEIKVITDRYDALNADLLAKQQKAEADRLQAAKESFNAYLREFGNYQQQREAIQADYDNRIAEAANAGERMMLEGQRSKAIADLDFEQWMNSGNIALAFGDLANLSGETIDALISDMEKYRDKVIATFDPDKIQKYEDALASLRRVRIDDSFGIFADAVPDYFKERKSVGSQLDSAGENVNAVYEKRAEIYNRIIDLQNRIKEGQAKGEDVSGLERELESAQVELDANSNAAKKAVDAFKKLQEQWDNLDSPEDKFYAICAAVGSATDLVADLTSQFAQMVDAMGADGLGKVAGTLSEVVSDIGGVAKGFANGGMVGGIAAAAGAVMKWTTSIFMAGDRKHERNIQRIQEKIDALQKSYEKLGDAADKAYSTDASHMIEQQNTLLRQQQVLIRQQMAEEEAKKKTDKDKINDYKERLEEIDKVLGENAEKAKEAIVGKDIKSAIDEFASLYAGAWDDGTDAAQKSMAAVKSIISSALTELLKKNIQPAAQNFYDTLAKAMEDGILTDAELANLDTIKREMDALAAQGEEQYKKIQQRYKDLDELKEELTDISFDSVRDNFKSLLSDMESTTEDFTKNWTDMIRNGLIEGLMNNKYDKMLKEWYDEFAAAMNDQKLTDSERDALRQQYDAIVQQGIADRNAVNAIVGGGAYSQQVSSGSAWNISQETGDELNGRFTAMVELEATNNVLVSDGNAIAREILATLRAMTSVSLSVSGGGDNSTLLDIKDMVFLSTGYLEDIAKYTKRLSEIESGISNMEKILKDRL